MIKRLNKNRFLRGSIILPWYKTESEYMKISWQTSDIYLMLKDLKGRLEFSSVRLKNVIRFTKSKHIRSELKFQQRILNEHFNQIDELIKENRKLHRENLEKEYGEPLYDYDSII